MFSFISLGVSNVWLLRSQSRSGLSAPNYRQAQGREKRSSILLESKKISQAHSASKAGLVSERKKVFFSSSNLGSLSPTASSKETPIIVSFENGCRNAQRIRQC